MPSATSSTPAYVETLSRIPKESFLFGPSPIQYLPRLTAELGCKVEIYAKREDCNSSLAYGGNKVRKLVDAKSKHATHLVSVGGVASNHTRAVTATAVASGLKAVTVQEKWVPIDPPLYDQTGNILLSRLMGDDEAFAEIEKAGGKPYYIPAGASDHELGGLGFVNIIVELAEQEEAQKLPFFDTLLGRGRKVNGIDASGKPAETKAQGSRIARNTPKLLDDDDTLEIPDEAIVLDQRFHAGIYGIPGPGTIEAMKFAARTDALITDPVYEGKSMDGMRKLITEGTIKPGIYVLYVHLGGQPALNAYSSYFGAEELK
ncbi:putative 1-aminocyclopropane-1-carboxylate deaminase [Cryoendolithus antarcticus]|uniref:Putative 1-aminocyclopropane-1-carboxylate deaminase n=1 Tax=Cryoendolithus antarcticus TaxID=1507870 RepID=A0A1V8T9C8_9PEZI|nr:putative 1-aminocyclopropane-1-carboxylate deaminase [Cryoendolithus antarcticus]